MKTKSFGTVRKRKYISLKVHFINYNKTRSRMCFMPGVLKQLKVTVDHICLLFSICIYICIFLQIQIDVRV